MFGSEVLEVAIGLITIYILLSLFCTTTTELITRMFALRSATLAEGIRNLLTDDNAASGGDATAKAFFDHPLIAKLGLKTKGHFSDEKKGNPSYINGSYFALALYDTLFPADPVEGAQNVTAVREKINTLPDDLNKPLLALLNDADNDLQLFRKNMEGWFDELMQRITGWYTRKAKLISLIIAIVVTFIFNADTIMMANTLMRNATMRDAIVATVGQLDADELEPEKDLERLQAKLLGTGMLGWMPNSADYEDAREIPTSFGDGFLKLAGLLLTAFLVSLGAPFWFDILNKISNMRDTGAPPENGKKAEDKNKNEVIVKVDTGATEPPQDEEVVTRSR